MTLDNKLEEDIAYSFANDQKFKDYFLVDKNVQTVEQLYEYRVCGAFECAGGVEGCPAWNTGILSRLGYLFDFWSNYFEINDNFYSKFHLRFDFSTNPKNKNMGDTDAGSIDNDELHNLCLKLFLTSTPLFFPFKFLVGFTTSKQLLISFAKFLL